MATVLKRNETNEPAARYNILDPNRGYPMMSQALNDFVQDPCKDEARKKLGYEQQAKPN